MISSFFYHSWRRWRADAVTAAKSAHEEEDDLPLWYLPYNFCREKNAVEVLWRRTQPERLCCVKSHIPAKNWRISRGIINPASWAVMKVTSALHLGATLSCSAQHRSVLRSDSQIQLLHMLYTVFSISFQYFNISICGQASVARFVLQHYHQDFIRTKLGVCYMTCRPVRYWSLKMHQPILRTFKDSTTTCKQTW